MSSTSIDLAPPRRRVAPRTPRGVSINGKFLSASMTGVHRVAAELIKQWNGFIGTDDDWEIVAPRDAHAFESLDHIALRRAGLFTWQPWEQVDLPRLAKGRLLVNLCNLAPIITPSVTLIHDAQVYLTPKSYSPAFVAWYKLALPLIGRSALKIVTVSEYSRAQLIKYKVAPAEKIAVVHNGVDHILAVTPSDAAGRRLGLKPRRYVVALANAQAHKNIAILFRAFAYLPDLTLVLVGAADRSAFPKSQIPGNVIFAGRVSDAELRGLYEEALCFACPSTTEGFGLPPLEAMRVGCPAVVAPCGALPEICGDSALSAHPDHSDAWIGAIASLHHGPDVRQNLSAAGAARAATFTWRRAGRAFFDIVREAEALSAVTPRA